MRNIWTLFLIGLLAVNNCFGQSDSAKYINQLGSGQENSWNNYLLMGVSLCFFIGAFYLKKKYIKKATQSK